MHVRGERVLLSYTLTSDGKPVTVQESPWLETHEGQTLFTRMLAVSAHGKPFAQRHPPISFTPLAVMAFGAVAGLSAVERQADERIFSLWLKARGSGTAGSAG